MIANDPPHSPDHRGGDFARATRQATHAFQGSWRRNAGFGLVLGLCACFVTTSPSRPTGTSGIATTPPVSSKATTPPAAKSRPSTGVASDEPLALDAGGSHACVVLGSGQVSCWGDNTSGQLGDGSTTTRAAPTRVAHLDDAEKAVAGRDFTCALRRDRTVSCWGLNRYGQLGTGRTSADLSASTRPLRVQGLAGVVSLFAGEFHACALSSRGVARCWGLGRQGQLGDLRSEGLMPAPVSGLRGATSLALGRAHTCALVQGGGVWCFGANDRGQLGRSGTVAPGRIVKVELDTAVSALRAAGDRTCATTVRGTVSCWGDGTSRPTLVPGLETSSAVALGAEHTCAIDPNGVLRCVGRGKEGQRGPGATGPTPNRVPLERVVQVAALDRSTCALDRRGALWCWGDNTAGVLGQGSVGGRVRRSATPVAGLRGATDLAAGDDFTCAIDLDGRVRCWGANEAGQLGDGTTTDRFAPSDPVAGRKLPRAKRIAARGRRACAALDDGALWCWGSTKATAGRVTRVPRLSSVTDVAVGVDHTCALTNSGQVHCFGDNRSSQSGSVGAPELRDPTAVAGLTDAVALVAGDQHTCALTRSGGVSCWGSRRLGQLADGSSGRDLETPVARATPVVGLPDAKLITAGLDHTCALRSAQTAVCWGRNDHQQLGSGTSLQWTTRLPVRDLPQASLLAAGPESTCAATSTGQLLCWGRTPLRTDTSDQAHPTQVARESGVPLQLAVGRDHLCIRRRDRSVHCLGDHSRGQTGDGGLPTSDRPLRVRVSQDVDASRSRR